MTLASIIVITIDFSGLAGIRKNNTLSLYFNPITR